MMVSHTTLPSRNAPVRRAARAALLFLFLGCYGELERFNGYERRVTLRDTGCVLVITTPGYNGSYPFREPMPIRVEITNGSTLPHVFDVRDRRRGDCNLSPWLAVPLQRDPVELLLLGFTATPGATEQHYVWRGRPVKELPPRFVIQPGGTRVLFDTMFVPPKNFTDIAGETCLRAWNFEVPAGPGIRRRGR